MILNESYKKRLQELAGILPEDLNDEGVIKTKKGYKFDFAKDTKKDIISLSFANGRSNKKVMNQTQVQYYFAYKYNEGQKDTEFLKMIKKMDQGLDPENLRLMINKAVIGFDHNFKLNEFDTIIYPKSSSLIIKEIATQCKDKSGVAEMLPDAFIKTLSSEVGIDYDAINKLPEKERDRLMKYMDRVKQKEGNFSIKNVFSWYRKYIKDFIIFNSEQDRRVFNMIVGKRVLLIDDYRTTGTTLREMINQLVQLLPREIVAFVFIKVS